eukprot:evm.model.scf_1679.2 EVM.evm.TU.scf_1679.2   scf_1679:26951-35335(-)
MGPRSESPASGSASPRAGSTITCSEYDELRAELDRLKAKYAVRHPGLFVVEPVQSQGGDVVEADDDRRSDGAVQSVCAITKGEEETAADVATIRSSGSKGGQDARPSPAPGCHEHVVTMHKTELEGHQDRNMSKSSEGARRGTATGEAGQEKARCDEKGQCLANKMADYHSAEKIEASPANAQTAVPVAIQQALAKYRKAKRLLRGQIQQRKQLGAMLFEERSRNAEINARLGSRLSKMESSVKQELLQMGGRLSQERRRSLALEQELEATKAELGTTLGMAEQRQSRLSAVQMDLTRAGLALKESETIREMVLLAFVEERRQGQKSDRGGRQDLDESIESEVRRRVEEERQSFFLRQEHLYEEQMKAVVKSARQKQV